MESKKFNPILNFRLGNLQEEVEDQSNNLTSDARNCVEGVTLYPAGSYITLTREAIDSTEFAG